MTKDKQMCLGCGTRPAVSSNGTVPLCSSCSKLAADKRRGVDHGKPKKTELQA